MKFRTNTLLLLVAIISYILAPIFFNQSMSILDYISKVGSDEEIIVNRGLDSLSTFNFIPKDFLILLIVSIFSPEGNVIFVFAFKTFIYIVISIVYVEGICRRHRLGLVFVSVLYAYVLLNPILLEWHNTLLRDDLIIAALMLYHVSFYSNKGNFYYKIMSYFLLMFTRPQIFLVILVCEVYRVNIHYIFKVFGIFIMVIFAMELLPIEGGLNIFDMMSSFPNTFRLAFFSPNPINLLDIISGELVTDASGVPYWFMIAFITNTFLLFLIFSIIALNLFNKSMIHLDFDLLTIPFFLFVALSFASVHSEDVGVRQMYPVQFFVSIFFITFIFTIIKNKRI